MTERLLIYLRGRANRRGLALVSERSLRRDLSLDRSEGAAALETLASSGAIEIISPLPFLVAKIRSSWSGSNPRSFERMQQISASDAARHIEVPVSSSAAAAATQSREVGGAGEGEALLEEVLAVLGPAASRDEFRRILARHHPATIHRCLKRVRATKAIRVSRAALFRSLLERLSY